jgi:hypothetical protein
MMRRAAAAQAAVTPPSAVRRAARPSARCGRSTHLLAEAVWVAVELDLVCVDVGGAGAVALRGGGGRGARV